MRFRSTTVAAALAGSIVVGGAVAPAAAAQADTSSATVGDYTVVIEEALPSGYFRGWAYDASRPGQAPEVRIGGDTYGAVINEAELRPDVKGGGPYGFSGWLNARELDGSSATLTVALGGGSGEPDDRYELPFPVDPRPGGSTPESAPAARATKNFTPLNRAPLGYLDSAGGGKGSGWVFDPDSADKSMPLEIHVECPAGPFNVFNIEARHPVTTGKDRADVRAAHPQFPVGAAGFEFAVPDPDRFQGRGCRVRATAQDQQGNPTVATFGLTTVNSAPANNPTLPFD